MVVEQPKAQARDIPAWLVLAVPLGLLAAVVIFFDLCWPTFW